LKFALKFAQLILSINYFF